MERTHYPRVSDILSVWANFNHIDPDVLAAAAQRGTDVHAYCAAYAQGLWTIEPEDHLKGYVQSFKTWYDKNVDELISSEERLYDDTLMITGKYDMIVRLKGRESLTLIDIKTSAAFRWEWPLQLAAYLHLLNLNNKNVMDSISLRLKKDGKPPCVKVYGDCNPFFKVFLSCLTAYDYFNRRKEVSND